MPSLVLASGSTYRRRLIARLVPDHEATDHRVDEDAVQAEMSGATPDEVALALAIAKAESIAADHSDAHVLGSDQVVDVDGAILGKAGSVEGARAQLTQLGGRNHRLVTAVCLRAPDGSVQTHTSVHLMRMRELSDDEIARYVDADQPLDCCGAYKIESLGISLFDATIGDDPTAIEGLPLMAVARMLRDAGWALP
ncbi:MAG: septum formation protein Maf [Deltaproteobacteria bacterium]|nr:septum formation protein Maf [Deltaproteobacteria bacterium]